MNIALDDKTVSKKRQKCTKIRSHTVTSRKIVWTISENKKRCNPTKMGCTVFYIKASFDAMHGGMPESEGVRLGHSKTCLPVQPNSASRASIAEATAPSVQGAALRQKG